VVLDSLPLTPSGKVNRRALPAPQAHRPDLTEAYEAPRTPVEEVVAGVWGEVLGLARVGVQDNFFELGGHSLLIGALVHQVQARIGPRLSMRAIFEAPTIAELAQLLAREGAQG